MPSIYEEAEEYLWSVAIKKVIAGVIGFLASQKAVAGITWLQSHGINITIDLTKFQTEMTALGIGSFVALHDFVKLKLGWKWL